MTILIEHHDHILPNSVLLILWQQLWKAISCFNMTTPAHKARSYHPASGADLTDALVAEWEQIPVAFSTSILIPMVLE